MNSLHFGQFIDNYHFHSIHQYINQYINLFINISAFNMGNHCLSSNSYVLSLFCRPNYCILNTVKPIYLAYFFLLTFYFNNSVDFFELNFLPFNLNFFHSLLLILLVHDLFVSYFSLIIDED